MNAPSSSSQGSSFKTSTLTSKSKSAVDRISTAATTSEASATTGESTSSEEHASGPQEPAPQSGRLWELTSSSSIPRESLSNAAHGSSSTRLYPEECRSLEDIVEELRTRRGTSETVQGSSFWHIQLDDHPWIRLSKQLLVDTFGKFVNFFSNLSARGTRTDETDMTSGREHTVLEVSSGRKSLGRALNKPHCQSCHEFHELDSSISPERSSLLVLTVGLLVTTFVIASLFMVRSRYQTAPAVDHAAKNFMAKMNINGTLFVKKSHHAPEKATTAVEDMFTVNSQESSTPMTTVDGI